MNDQTQDFVARRSQRRSHGRKFAKVDTWGWVDIRRDNALSFAEVSLLRVITEHADHRSRMWTGSNTELHELTGLGRKTVRLYLDNLGRTGVLVEKQKALGGRLGLIDVSRHYDELIVPSERKLRAADHGTTPSLSEPAPALRSEGAASASTLRQITHPTRGNTDSGGIEAVEDVEVQDSQPSPDGLRKLYEEACASWPPIQDHLDNAIKEQGLHPGDRWWLEADRTGNGEKFWNIIEGVVAGFENF